MQTLTTNIEAETANYDMDLFGNDLVEFQPNKPRLSEQPLGRLYSNEFIDLRSFKKMNHIDYLNAEDILFRVNSKNVLHFLYTSSLNGVNKLAIVRHHTAANTTEILQICDCTYIEYFLFNEKNGLILVSIEKGEESEFIVINDNLSLLRKVASNNLYLVGSNDHQVYYTNKFGKICVLDWNLKKVEENKYDYLNKVVNSMDLMHIGSINDYDVLLFEGRLEIFHQEKRLKALDFFGKNLSSYFSFNSKNEIVVRDGRVINHFNLKGDLVKQTQLTELKTYL